MQNCRVWPASDAHSSRNEAAAGRTTAAKFLISAGQGWAIRFRPSGSTKPSNFSSLRIFGRSAAPAWQCGINARADRLGFAVDGCLPPLAATGITQLNERRLDEVERIVI
jgi:hypothetical protein